MAMMGSGASVTTRQLLDVLRRLDERGQGDLPVWVSMGAVFGHAEGVEVMHRGEWHGVLITDRIASPLAKRTGVGVKS